MTLFERLIKTAKDNKQHIILAEGAEPRTLQAADRLLQEDICHITLIGNPEKINGMAAESGLKNIGLAKIVDPEDSVFTEKYAQLFYELRKSKGVTIEDARKKVKDPLYLGCLIIKNEEADGQVSGALSTTGDVLRAAFQVIKPKKGISVVSGAFLMLLPEGVPYGTDGMLVFADCAVVPNPTAPELAEIAVASAETARCIAGIDPRVAILSFSTKGSARNEMVDKVIEATDIARKLAPNLPLDGELQADAAIVPAVGKSKAPESDIAGTANVLVFPSLEVGNITYKLVQRISGAEAVGPILQGLAKPVNDLSRGCSPEDIYKTVIITCNQSINAKK